MGLINSSIGKMVVLDVAITRDDFKNNSVAELVTDFLCCLRNSTVGIQWRRAIPMELIAFPPLVIV